MFFLKVLRKLSGEAFLEDEINELETEVKIKRFIQYTVLASSAIMLVSAPVTSSHRKDIILGELGLGTAFGFSSALIAKSREEIEARFSSFMNLSRENYKTEIKHRAVKEEVAIELSRDLGIVATLEGLPIHAISAYAQKYGIPQGMFAHLLKDNSPEPGSTSPEISVVNKSLGVASPDKQNVDLYINKDAMAMVKALSQQYPEYIKDPDNPVWLLELIESSSHKDMGKRANQHFMIVGSTQDGKSTLAGVIAKGISDRSESPAVVAVHDAKKKPGMMDITRWLCNFTYKIDGYENTTDWIELCEKLSNEQFRLVGKVGGSCKGVPELILMQDEVNTVYGQGKGYGKMVTPETAKDAQSLWLYQCTQMAGLRGHFIMMGQSPLAGDTGLSLPAMNNCCFIAMGNTTGYILDPKNRANYLRNVKEEVLELLAKVCELLNNQGVRYALVRPTRGNPYVALIPTFDVDDISLDTLERQTDKTIEAEILNTEPGEEDLSLGSEMKPGDDTQQPPVTSEQASESDLKLKIFLSLVEWMKICFDKHGCYPSHQAIVKTWEEETGDILDDAATDYLIQMLMSRLEE